MNEGVASGRGKLRHATQEFDFLSIVGCQQFGQRCICRIAKQRLTPFGDGEVDRREMRARP